jgi:hypothetical protein
VWSLRGPSCDSYEQFARLTGLSIFCRISQSSPSKAKSPAHAARRTGAQLLATRTSDNMTPAIANTLERAVHFSSLPPP